MFEPLVSFIKKNNRETDIFCFQEVYKTITDQKMVGDARANIFEEIVDVLPDHEGHFASSEDNWSESGITDFPLQFGQAIFVRKSLDCRACGNVFVHKYHGAERSEIGFSAPRAMQHVCIKGDEKEYTICNMHGLHNGSGKDDSGERIKQSENIKKFLDSVTSSKILCGDLNLLPDTKSMAILEKGMQNLIKDNGVISTRSSYYQKEPRFADYMLVSPDIEILDFKVLPDEVSDHLPLLLKFQ